MISLVGRKYRTWSLANRFIRLNRKSFQSCLLQVKKKRHGHPLAIANIEKERDRNAVKCNQYVKKK